MTLRLVHDDVSLRIRAGDVEVARYVYRPWDAQLESPRPYFHPLRTLAGDVVSLYRPHDHVWHKGLAWSLPNIGRAGADPSAQQNFWGGTTYLRGRGYEQLPNNGSMRHREFVHLNASPERVWAAHRLDWVTQAGETWFDELRSFAVTIDDDAWTIAFATSFTNVSGGPLTIGSPTTQGRDNAGYGGLFWRGPRSFTGGTVLTPEGSGGDEMMGARAPWLGFTGRHDDHGRSSTLVFVDDPGNAGHPGKWFVRSQLYACLCPAPFFDAEAELAPGDHLVLRYAVVLADGAYDAGTARRLAELGSAAMAGLEDAGPHPEGEQR